MMEAKAVRRPGARSFFAIRLPFCSLLLPYIVAAGPFRDAMGRPLFLPLTAKLALLSLRQRRQRSAAESSALS